MNDLFDEVPDHVMTPDERRKLSLRLKSHMSPTRGLHAGIVGAGPFGETCGSCQHIARHQMSRTYWKCGLCKSRWTRGPGTDIRKGDPACTKWEAKEKCDA